MCHVGSEATAPLISRTDETPRKPLSLLLSVTVTVIRASTQARKHTQHGKSQALDDTHGPFWGAVMVLPASCL